MDHGSTGHEIDALDLAAIWPCSGQLILTTPVPSGIDERAISGGADGLQDRC